MRPNNTSKEEKDLGSLYEAIVEPKPKTEEEIIEEFKNKSK